METKVKDTKIIAISLQKGGVGKTMLAVNVAANLAIENKSVLIIDIDTHCSATKYLGAYDTDSPSIFDVLTGENDITEAIKTFTYKYRYGTTSIDILPATDDLHCFEDAAYNMPYAQFALKEAVEKIKHNYDYIIVDCPPESDILLKNAFNTAEYFVLPVLPDANSFQELSPTISQIRDLRSVESEGKILGCVLNQRTNRPLLINGNEIDVRDLYRSILTLFDTEIPVSSHINNSFANNLPLPFYHTTIKRCDSIHYAFRKLTAEILAKIKDCEEGATENA